MKTLTRLIAAFVVAGACAYFVSAQTVATTTTLSADLTAGATQLSVTSASGFTVNNFLWVDHELMQIRAVSGTAITVLRGQNGTRQMAHDNAERVVTGAANHFNAVDPNFGADCTRGSGEAGFLPWVNIRTGVIWTCGGSGQNGVSGLAWAATNVQPITFNSIPTSF